jgi:hypothetical protein
MPAKEFDAFTRLDASDVNAYLANKSISNAIINGAFEINQRGFTSTAGTSGVYGHDRWVTSFVDGTSTYSNETFTLGSAPVAGYEGRNFARLISSGQTASNALTALRQPIEGVRNFANQTVTVSFWAKSGSGTPNVAVYLSQNFGQGGSPSAAELFGTTKQQISTLWTRYFFTLNVPSIAGKTIGNVADSLELRIVTSAGTDRAAYTDSLGIQSTTVDIWGVQLEPGTVANDFRRNANSIQGELAACQRYYYRTGGTTAFEYHGLGSAGSTTQGRIMLIPKQTMRVGPISIEFGNLGLYDSNSTLAVTTCTLDQSATNSVAVVASVASGLTQFRPYSLISNNNTSGFVALSAEL